MSRNSLTCLTCLVAFSFFLIVAALHLAASGQGTLPPCTTPPYHPDISGRPIPIEHSWPQGTAVTVIIDQRFSPEQRQAVAEGFNKWLHSGHGVTFTFQVGAVPDTRTKPPINSVYVLADPVNRADNENFASANGRVEGAYMRLGICTRPENLVGKTAHEAGHEFGLANSGGGNSDGKIGRQDAVFASLRLWRDANHNGVSEAGELHTLSGLGLESIDLNYKTSKRRDAHGNVFRYRAKVRDASGRQLGRWAWDVFLVPER